LDSSLLKLEGVYKQYAGHTAVNDLSFELSRGQIFGLLGPNGAGKSSLIRMICAITKADKGQIFFDGELVGPKTQRKIGYMPEERGLYKKMRVSEQIMYLARLKGLSKKEAKKRMTAWLQRFDIEDWKKKRIEELSKGMQQKIQFIVTVIHEPELLILDEPFSGLDPLNSQIIREEIYRLKEEGSTILFSTHRMEQVEQICEQILLINKGEKLFLGKVAEVKERFKKNEFLIQTQGPAANDFAQAFELLDQGEDWLKIRLQEAQTSAELFAAVVDAGLPIRRFEEILPSLQEIFIEMVQE